MLLSALLAGNADRFATTSVVGGVRERNIQPFCQFRYYVESTFIVDATENFDGAAVAPASSFFSVLFSYSRIAFSQPRRRHSRYLARQFP